MQDNETGQSSFQLGLLENGLDFILGAAERAVLGTPRDLKYAVLNLVDGVELLVKARLEKEHWALLFDEVDKASQEKLKQGDFKSVDFAQAYNRLRDIAGVEIDNTAWKHLNELRKLRNRTRHYNTDFELEQVRSLLAECLNFCHSFCLHQLAPLPEDDRNKKLLDEIWGHLVRSREFVAVRLQAINANLKGRHVWECPLCWQKAVVVDADDTVCEFCRVAPNPRNLAEHNSEGRFSNPSDPGIELENCPECWVGLIVHLMDGPDHKPIYRCSYCGESGYGLEYCARCGVLAKFSDGKEPDIEFCENCMEDILRQ